MNVRTSSRISSGSEYTFTQFYIIGRPKDFMEDSSGNAEDVMLSMAAPTDMCGASEHTPLRWHDLPKSFYFPRRAQGGPDDQQIHNNTFIYMYILSLMR